MFIPVLQSGLCNLYHNKLLSFTCSYQFCSLGYVIIIIINSVELYMFIPVLQSVLIFIVTGTGEEQEKQERYFSECELADQ